MDPNIKFADNLYTALQGSASRRASIIREYAKAVEDTGLNSILRAQVVWSINQRYNFVPPDQLPTLSGLASVAEGLTDDIRRKQRDYLTLVGFWSHTRLEHYRFHECSARALRFWLKLAFKYVRWQACVDAVNFALISRHERSLQDPKTNRLGVRRPQAKATRLPAELQDVTAACNNISESEREALQSLQQAWLNPCSCLLDRIKSCGHEPRFYMVSLDGQGMLSSDLGKKALPGRTCSSCIGLAQARKRRCSTIMPPRQTAATNLTARDDWENVMGTTVITNEDFQRMQFTPAIQVNRGIQVGPGVQIQSGILIPNTSHARPKQRSKHNHHGETSHPFSLSLNESSCILPCKACEGQCLLALSPNNNIHEFEIAHKLADLQRQRRCSRKISWAQPRIHFARISSSLDACKDETSICEVSGDTFCSWAEHGKVCPDIVVVRAGQHLETIDFQEYARLSRRRHAGMEINLSVRNGDSSKLGSTSVEDVLGFLSGIKVPSEPLAFLGLEGVSSLEKPAFLQLERFKLLQTLADRRSYAAARKNDGSCGKTLCDVEKALAYAQFTSTGAYIGAHVDVLAGTWIRVVFGAHILWVVPPNSMSDDDWNEFAAHGSSWSPGSKAQATILKAGDVLFLGPRVIHGGLTIENSVVEGGAVWDDRNILTIMSALVDLVENPTMTDSLFPLQLPEIVEELEIVLELYEPSESARKQILEKTLALHLSGCQCLALCDQYCPCRIIGSTCTPWCGRHQSSSIWNCMLAQKDHSSW